jgi:hypothetical protein
MSWHNTTEGNALLGPFVREHLIRLQSYLLEEPHILDQPRFDVIIKEELRENPKLFPEELVGEIDCGVHDPGAVRSDRVADVPNVDSLQELVV